MKKEYKIIAILVFLFVALIILSGIGFFNDQLAKVDILDDKTITIGYCPNIATYGDSLVAKYDLQQAPYDNSILSMADLQAGKIDMALTSRRAHPDEYHPNTKEKLLKDNFVLVHNQPGAIHYRDLQNLTIRTYLTVEEAYEVLPSKTNIVVDLERRGIGEEDLNDLLLLKWSDFENHYSFVSVFDDFGTREEFRGPFLYYFDDQFVNFEL